MAELLVIAESTIGVAAALATIRLVKGPTLADRVLSLDLVLMLVAALVSIESARRDSEYFVPVLVMISLVAFLGTVIAARLIERRDV